MPITQQQLDQWEHTGVLIQDVANNLTDDQREFIISGMTIEEWQEMENTFDHVMDTVERFEEDNEEPF